MNSERGSKANNGVDEYVWNHTFIITTQRLVVGRGVLIMVFDHKANLKWSGKDTETDNIVGKPLTPGDNVVVYDAVVRFH